MTDNQKAIAEVQANITLYEKEREPEWLRKAFLTLNGVDLSREADPASRSQMRALTLGTWLQILGILDTAIDPAFDPTERIDLNVDVPPQADGVVFPPGAQPSVIADPATRARYEKAVAANRAKQENQRLQILLKRLDERIMPGAGSFIRQSYTLPSDQAEARAAIDKLIQAPARKAQLLKPLAPPLPTPQTPPGPSVP